MSEISALMIVDSDVLVRHQLAQYLRNCGLHVVEASSSEEALTFLDCDKIEIASVLTDAEITGQMNGFGLAKWIRENRKDIDIVLVGTLEAAVDKAAGLCEQAKNIKKPYEHHFVLERIKWLQSERVRLSG